MLAAFEQRLADLLADAMLGQVFSRGRVVAPQNGAAAAVRIVSAAAAAQLGDDTPRLIRRPPALALRTTLRLAGEAAIELAGAAPLLPLADRILVVLQAQALRDGAGFETGADLGFALDSFRFVALGAAPDRPDVLALRFGFDGLFWPVLAEPEGPAIVRIPLRLAVLPAGVPQGLRARAGGADLAVPLGLDLRATGGAAARIVARLAGAAPPGSLVGDAADVPPGHVAFAVDADGIARLLYRPPATLGAPAEVLIDTALAHPGRATVPLARITVAVDP
jgi:hypothetical protein